MCNMPNGNIFVFLNCCGGLKLLEEQRSVKATFSKSNLTCSLHSEQNYTVKSRVALILECLYVYICCS